MRRLLLALTSILLASTAIVAAPTVVGAAPPDAPQNVSAVLSGDDVVVTWDAPASDGGSPLTGYLVSVNGGAASVVPVTPRSFTVVDPAPGSSVTVTVAARNADGDSGATSSNTVAVPAVAPSVPQNVSAVLSGDDVVVTWDAPASNGGSAITGYSVSVNGGAAQPVGATPRSFTVVDPAPGSSVTVTVAAVNAVGSSAPVSSNTVAVPFQGASAPQNVAAALAGPAANFVRVTFDPPADLGGGTISNYTVNLSNGDSLTVGSSPATFENVAAGTTVTATVTANTQAGAGATSAASNAVTTANVPGPVTGLIAGWAGAGNTNAINVDWTAPAFAGGGGLTITGYVVEVSPALENSIPVVDPGETSVVIGGLDQGTSYTITVRAQNDLGNSAPTTSGSVLVPTTPGTVTDLVVQQSPPFSAGIVLTWDLPLDDGGSPITGFRVTVDDQATDVGPTVTTVSFANLPVGDHNVTVRAITAVGLGPAVTSPNFEVKAFPPFDSEEAFVTQIYADFLRRTPDAGGLAFWTARVADDGSNIQEIVEAFMRSPEYSPRRSVARLYFAYFNRQPDKGGFDFWTTQIASGAGTLESASQSFALSPEFQATYGSLSDAEFVVLVYNNVLARRPDTGGFRFWLAQLQAGMPRGRLMTLFSESPENVELSRAAVDVTVTYDGMLQRRPESSGFIFWRDRIAGDDNALATLIREFYFSPEYAERVTR